MFYIDTPDGFYCRAYKGKKMKKIILFLAILAPVVLSACCGCETEPIVQENHKLIVPPNFGAKPAK